jgi:hypothetical protein
MTLLPPRDLIRQAVDKGPEGVARLVHVIFHFLCTPLYSKHRRFFAFDAFQFTVSRSSE